MRRRMREILKEGEGKDILEKSQVWMNTVHSGSKHIKKGKSSSERLCFWEGQHRPVIPEFGELG